jgi:hypothetical protein
MRDNLEIHTTVTNIGTRPVTIPTTTYFGAPSWWISGGEAVKFGFDVGAVQIEDKKLIPSPARFFPVTLAPGECTELPVAEPKRDKAKTVKVSFFVDKEYAERYGWWSGEITKTVVIGEGPNPFGGGFIQLISKEKEKEEPNQALLPTPTAVTPPAGQEPRQP